MADDTFQHLLLSCDPIHSADPAPQIAMLPISQQEAPLSKFNERDEAYFNGRRASWRDIAAGLVLAAVIGAIDLAILGAIL